MKNSTFGNIETSGRSLKYSRAAITSVLILDFHGILVALCLIIFLPFGIIFFNNCGIFCRSPLVTACFVIPLFFL